MMVQKQKIMRLLLHITLVILSGGTPLCWPWAYYAPELLGWHTTTPFHVWCLATAAYFANGMLVELLPLRPLQPHTMRLSLSTILPQVTINLASCLVLVLFAQSSHRVSDARAVIYLLYAALGNELTYACIHRLLHTKQLYFLHLQLLPLLHSLPLMLYEHIFRLEHNIQLY